MTGYSPSALDGKPTLGNVALRDVIEADLPVFFVHQLDPDATRMAAFPSRNREAFFAHWRKIMADEKVTLQTILFDGQVAGNIVSFEMDGEREVGYWVGKEFWGKGIASRALSAFLELVTQRPLYAHVAKHNHASFRVLQKCGFVICGEEKGFSTVAGEPVEGLILKLG